jgi:predicted amidohydrolase YtcJ
VNTSSPGSSDGVIYTARVIRTANPSRPTATAIAVRDAKVLAVGTLEECQEWGITTVDNRFADMVLTAGFVEAHSHIGTGMFATIPYVGFFPRLMPDGIEVPGLPTTQAFIERLRELEKLTEDGAPLVVAGFDPIYLEGERLTAAHLDEVSMARPIFVMHANAHLATVNTVVLNKYDIGPNHPMPGIGTDDNNQPNGELREAAAMGLAKDEYRVLASAMFGLKTFVNFAATMRNAGITTATDLANGFAANPTALEQSLDTSSRDDFPLRVVTATFLQGGPDAMPALVEKIRDAQKKSHDKLMFPIVKLVLDGSIQGFTATIEWPGYFRGENHGQFLLPPEQVVDVLRPFHEAGIGIHCHCNGNMASEVFINAIEQLLREHSWLDHRHTVTHAQLITHAQMRKAKSLGMSANFFVNHMWFWGDQHRDITVGPDRAAGLNPCATADRIGLPYSFHSDAPVTPPSHLHTIWAAVNRVAPSGRVIGESERISIDRAFHAATIDAAYQLHLDHIIGSLEVGKFADMTVLTEDIYGVVPEKIRDIKVWGTVVGGVVHQNPV